MLNDRKITDWTQPVSSLDDRPQMTASALKAAFDSNTNQLKPAVNGMIDDLTGTGGAGNIGVDVIAGVTGTTVQAMLAALKALIDLCDTSETVDDKLDLKADKTTTDKLVKTITLNADTGVFTIQTDDGTTTTIDTLLEKIPVNCYLDGQEFVLVLDDGTEQRADLSDFITETEFTDSSTIDFSVTGSNVTATIKNGSITLSMLENTVMSTLQGYMTAAQTAASNAATSETNAGTYRDQAQESATAAASSASEAGAKSTLSESWAIGGTGTRTGEDTNNSKYFAQQASSSATTAQGWSDSAMEQADKSESAAKRAEQAAADAEAIAGGDYIPNSQKGVAGGVATLGSDGKVSSTQLPEMNYIPTSQKGAASGVASLDATGKLEETQKPDYTASEVGAVPTTRTVNEKELSADVTLTGEDIKTSSMDSRPISSQLSNLNTLVGGATTPQAALAALGAGVRPNLLINPFFRIDQRNKGTYNSSGYTLDGWCNGAGSDGTITQNPDGAEFSIVRTGISFYQPIDAAEFQLSGKKVTFSILYSGGALRLTISRFDGSWHHYTSVNFPASENMVLAMVSAELGDLQSTDQTRAAIYAAASNTTFQVYCAKLEVGDTQTLAYQDEDGAWQLLPQPESDYATQLAKCQRYQLKLPYGSSQNFAPVGFGCAQNASSVRILIPTPITMRTSPAISYLSGDINGITIVSNGKNIVPNSITRIIVMNYGVAIEFAVSGADNSMPCVMRTTSAYLLLDANL